ncbi:MAG: VOC family protein [Coriobacteriia bacterium]|nr:VOC family protein [Coriobacteriia bacterium]MBN2839857.1 VOC family protein [Coriobacteriia bacterium]
MDLRPDHIGIVVSDLERSKSFYRTLGFIDGNERVMADKTLSFMRLGALEIELFAYAEPVPAPDLPERVLGFKHLALETQNIDAAFSELREAGIIAEDIAIREMPGGWRLLFFPDPDGMEIEIKQA